MKHFALFCALLASPAAAQPYYSPGAIPLPIPSAAVDGNGHLILTYPNTAPMDVGAVVGPAGSVPLGNASHFGRTAASTPVSVALGLLTAGPQTFTIPITGAPGTAAPAANDMCLVGLASGSTMPTGVTLLRCDVASANSLIVTVSASVALTALTTKTINLNLFWLG